jgi:hypothetical protein
MTGRGTWGQALDRVVIECMERGVDRNGLLFGTDTLGEHSGQGQGVTGVESHFCLALEPSHLRVRMDYGFWPNTPSFLVVRISFTFSPPIIDKNASSAA